MARTINKLTNYYYLPKSMFCGILKHVTLVNYWIRWFHRGDFTLLDQWVDSKWVRNFSFWYPRGELFWLFASSLNHVHL